MTGLADVADAKDVTDITRLMNLAAGVLRFAERMLASRRCPI
jgi:hypothetical protein